MASDLSMKDYVWIWCRKGLFESIWEHAFQGFGAVRYEWWHASKVTRNRFNLRVLTPKRLRCS